jgi:hypothetical protein
MQCHSEVPHDDIIRPERHDTMWRIFVVTLSHSKTGIRNFTHSEVIYPRHSFYVTGAMCHSKVIVTRSEVTSIVPIILCLESL